MAISLENVHNPNTKKTYTAWRLRYVHTALSAEQADRYTVNVWNAHRCLGDLSKAKSATAYLNN